MGPKKKQKTQSKKGGQSTAKDNGATAVAKKAPKPENKSKTVRSGKLSRTQVCDMISDLSETIIQDPTKAFSSPDAVYKEKKDGEEIANNKATPSLMAQLLQIASYEGDEYISRMAIMSLLVLFKDLVPSYRIRMPTAAELTVKVTLETKNLWDFERNLLTCYQQYLKLLENIWNRGKNEKVYSILRVTSMLCMCELLKSAWHFNFRANLLTMVMRQINNGQCPQVSDACCAAVEDIFRKDTQGDVALQATRLLAKAIRDRGFKVQPQVLKTFLALPLRVHLDEAEAVKLATAAKKRKRDKDLKEIDKELQEGDAKVDKIMLARSQSDTLQTVVLTYFRILKSDNLGSDSHMTEVLPACLEGLAKFSHLVNIDTVMDLLEVLKGLMKDIDALPLSAALNCVLTSFQTLAGPGKSMNIDQKDFISPLYRMLPRLVGDPDVGKSTASMLKCLDAAFVRRREFSTTRVAAFLKQILTVAMFLPPSSSIPLTAFARHLLQRYSNAHQMMENEEDAITSGQYCPDVEEPELANPFSTSAWEVATLKFHWHQGIVTQAEGAATCKMLQMPIEDPVRLLKLSARNEEELYIKFQKSKKRHPLEPKNADDAKKGRCRFIQPSSRSLDHLQDVGVFLK